MNIVCYGGGTNSTALLIESMHKGIDIDLILFADTGGEKPHTYQYVKMFDKWLRKWGYPGITRVQAQNINGSYITLHGWCLEEGKLPSIAYGFKSCSQKHKLAPQTKFLNHWPPAILEWAEGRKITKFVGFDADESHRAKDYEDDRYDVTYPLIEWDMGRDECIQVIEDANLALPGKSSCYFCPSSKKKEIIALSERYPALMEKALMMERLAIDKGEMKVVKGLGRNFAWADVIKGIVIEDSPIEEDCGCYDGM